MAAAHVQERFFRDFGATNATLAFSGSVTSGNLICGTIYWKTNPVTLSSITDSASNTYTLLHNPTEMGGSWRGAMFYAMNVTGGTVTLTASFSAATDETRFVIHEASGLALTGALDQSLMFYQGSTGTITDGASTGNVTTTEAGEYIYGSFSAVFGSVGAPGTGYTGRITGLTATSETQIQTSAGSIAATFTSGADDGALMGIMTFKVPAAAGGQPTNKRHGGVIYTGGALPLGNRRW